MTSHARSWQQEAEAQFFETLRARYEDEGFTFTAHSDITQLPDFWARIIPTRSPRSRDTTSSRSGVGKFHQRSGR